MTATVIHEFTQRQTGYRIVRKHAWANEDRNVKWCTLERSYGRDAMGQPSWHYCDPTDAPYELFEELARLVLATCAAE